MQAMLFLFGELIFGRPDMLARALLMGAAHDGGLGGCDTNFEFELALDVILDGLERLRQPA